jgi:hypothetical protein
LAPRPGHFTPRKDPVPIVQKARWAPELVWTCAKNLAPTGIRSPDRPGCSQSLYISTELPGPQAGTSAFMQTIFMTTAAPKNDIDVVHRHFICLSRQISKPAYLNLRSQKTLKKSKSQWCPRTKHANRDPAKL